MKPADLRPGHRIARRVPNMDGTITVSSDPWVNVGGARDHICVAVEVSDPGWWTVDDLAVGVGAVDAWFTDLPRRYRLRFLPDTDVEVEP